MNFHAADAIVRAVLYEGYLLYPYRPTAIKNRQRWSFGGLYPAGCTSLGSTQLHTQCLVEANANTRIEARVRWVRTIFAAWSAGTGVIASMWATMTGI